MAKKNTRFESDSIEFSVPKYDRNKLKLRILHVGFGGFARAHLAVYLEETLNSIGGDWGVGACRLHTGSLELTALKQNNFTYNVVEIDEQSTLVRKMGVVTECFHPQTDSPAHILAPFLSKELAIVSLTITEKGYHTDGKGHLDPMSNKISRDLENPEQFNTAVGYIVHGLKLRRESGLDGLTILSCDNLPNNGQVTKNVVVEFADRVSPQLSKWIEQEVAFPSTMVDRIVPALSNEESSLIEKLAGESSPNDIVCESFRQWVIEDNFASGRPELEVAGVQFTNNVKPFEEMKLRMLNGSHSFLAYLGVLAGYQTISDCMGDAEFADSVRDLMLIEQASTLTMSNDFDIEKYATDLLNRFSNTHLRHKTIQIASDGSQKLPQRMLESVNFHLENGTNWTRLALGIAGWITFVQGKDELGNGLPLSDPLADHFKLVAQESTNDAEFLNSILSIDSIFPASLSSNSNFREQISNSFSLLREKGVRSALSSLKQ